MTILQSSLSLPVRYAHWWLNLVKEDPGHVFVETALILFVLYILLFKKTLNTRALALGTTNLTPKEVEELIADWKPEPLVPAVNNVDKAACSIPVVDKVEDSYYVLATGRRLLNMVSFDFLGIGQGDELKKVTLKALDQYGCGSCGPRGFYGTVDSHLKTEADLAAFLGAEDAIAYSDAAATVSSCIPAFAKKGDLILADRGVTEPVQTGLDLSRSTIKFFKHGDMADLERLLKEVAAQDKATKRDVLDQRRFIVVEGLYRNYGDICPLPQLLELKARYSYRLVVDESISFGTLGATGRGLAEHFNLPASCIDISTMSFAAVLGSIGGACVGTSEVVDHQRLSGAGYCFSAAAPPFTAAAASEALRILKEQGPELLSKMRANSLRLQEAVKNIPSLRLVSCPESPLVHVAVAGTNGNGENGRGVLTEQYIARCRQQLEAISAMCAVDGVAVVVSNFTDKEKCHPQPTLRISVTARHTSEQIDFCASALQRAAQKTSQAQSTGSLNAASQYTVVARSNSSNISSRQNGTSSPKSKRRGGSGGG